MDKETIEDEGVKDPLSGPISLPVEKDVRPLSGPFGLEEDLTILKDLDETIQKNAKSDATALMAVTVLILVTCIGGLFFLFSLEGTYVGPVTPLLKGALTGIFSLFFIMIFPLELSSESADLMDPLIRKFSKEWDFGPDLLAALCAKGRKRSYDRMFPEEIFMLSPMQREAFFLSNDKKFRNSYLTFYVTMMAFGLPFATFMLSGSVVLIIRAIAVSLLTSVSVFYITLNFKYNYATSLSPRTWYLVRKVVEWLVLVLFFVVLAIFLWGLYVSGTLDGAAKAMDSNYFLMVLLAIPRAVTDLTIASTVPYPSVVISFILWGAGLISYRRLKRTDHIRAKVKLYVMGRYSKGIEDGPKGPRVVPLTEVKTTEQKKKVQLRSQGLDWSKIDEGPGSKVLMSKIRLYEYNTRAKYYVGFVVISLLIIFGFVKGMLNTNMDLMSIGMEMIPIIAFLFLSLSAVLPGREEGEKTDILRMLPLDGKEVLWAMMDPILKYCLGPYLFLTVAFFSAFQVSDLAFLIFFLAVVPALTLAFIPALVYFYVNDRGEGMLLTGMFMGGFILMGIYFNLMSIAVPLPLWVFMAMAAASIFPIYLLSRRLFIRRFHKSYLNRPNWKRKRKLSWMAAGLIMILLIVPPIALTGTGVIRTQFTPEKIAWTVSGYQTVINTTVEYDGSVIVPSGSTLEIRDSVVKFKVAALGETELYIEPGGLLTVVNSTLTADTYFEFRIEGKAFISDSRVRRTWGSDIDAGIMVYGQGTVIQRTVVEDGMSHGINIEDTSPLIQDCVIQNNKAAGFFIADSSATLINNTIRNNHLGILMWTSSDTLRNNTIQNNSGDGMVLDRAGPSLMYNRFYDNKGYAIVIIGDRGPLLLDNIYVNNTKGDIDRRPRENSDALTMLGTLISVPLIILPLMALGRQRERMFRKIERQQKD